MPSNIQEPWRSFLRDLDQIAKGPVAFHCIGGFVVTNFYGFSRETRDIDVLTAHSSHDTNELFECSREGSELHKKHKVYLDRVTVIEAYPEDYEDRLVEMYAGEFNNIRLLVPEAHDLALMKLQRNNEKDREDVKYLARTGHLTPDILKERYEKEMRSYIALPERRTDHVVKLWIDMINEDPESHHPKDILSPR
jgi:uncharacterized nucleotidyltransferase DUF6036